MNFKFSIPSSLIGFIIAFLSFKIPSLLQFSQSQSKVKYHTEIALLGDIGGTNLRLQLVSILPGQDSPVEIYRQSKFNVKDFQTLESAISQFLKGSLYYPNIAIIAIAGPIINNSVYMANAQQWGRIYGQDLGQKLKIPYFKLINDFEAASYGILLMKQDDLQILNNRKIVQSKTRGVIGPGTGLGNSVLFNAPFKMRKRVYVLPSQGGQGDYWYIDKQTNQLFEFIKKQMNVSYVTVEKSFTGPTIPLMYKFFAQKFPDLEESNLTLKGQQITKRFTEDLNENIIANKVCKLFLKMYGNTIGNFIVNHLPFGGIYLIGSITKQFVSYLQKDDFLRDFKQRHPQMIKVVQNIPIVYVKQIDLGLKGAFVYARRRISDKQTNL